jgi:hypothetical protein
MPAHKTNSRKKVAILLIIIFSHIFPVIVSAFYDQATHTSHNVKLTELKYWLWFFTWWSAWTSLLTVPWAIYKLFALKRKKNSFREQVLDIVVAETNLISGIFFCGGGFFLTFHTTIRNPEILFPLIGNTKTVYIYLLYNFFWHILAPGLVFYYFWKYCQVDQLAKKKSLGLVANLLNFNIYLFYVFLRPLISVFSNSAPDKLPHSYPPNYPYAPGFWMVGEYANSRELKAQKSSFLIWNWQPNRLTGLIWLIIILVPGYVFLSLLFHWLVKIKLKRDIKNSNL